MNSKDWQPNQYLKFANERTQPSIDLVSHINLSNPRKIIDIGCGPGNSTQVLVNKWPNAQVLGIDNSPAMIEKAKSDYPNQQWKIMDANNLDLNEKYDLVFSNATIQWLPNHDELIKILASLTKDKGALAIQLPFYLNMPISKEVAKVAAKEKWLAKTNGCFDNFYVYQVGYYYDVLYPLFDRVELWETSYFHVMDSHMALMEMIRTTGMKPYLDRLNSDIEKVEFENEILDRLKTVYPKQKNGKVLFPFERIFFIGNK